MWILWMALPARMLRVMGEAHSGEGHLAQDSSYVTTFTVGCDWQHRPRGNCCHLTKRSLCGRSTPWRQVSKLKTTGSDKTLGERTLATVRPPHTQIPCPSSRIDACEQARSRSLQDGMIVNPPLLRGTDCGLLTWPVWNIEDTEGSHLLVLPLKGVGNDLDRRQPGEAELPPASVANSPC